MTNPSYAIVVLVVGDHHIEHFHRYFHPSVRRYCDQYGYDLHVVTTLFEPLVPFNRKKFFWQRLLIPGRPEFSHYDYVLTLDSDIYISENAPPLPILVPGKMGCVNERKFGGNYDWRVSMQAASGLELTGKDWYRLSGEEKDYDDHIQGGFVLYQPSYHGKLFTDLYHQNVESYERYHQDDQSFLSSYGIDHGLIQWLDERYDCVWGLWRDVFYTGYSSFPKRVRRALMTTFMERNWFCHFSGSGEHRLLAQILFPRSLAERMPEFLRKRMLKWAR